jgi:hypothetical protein
VGARGGGVGGVASGGSLVGVPRVSGPAALAAGDGLSAEPRNVSGDGDGCTLHGLRHASRVTGRSHEA